METNKYPVACFFFSNFFFFQIQFINLFSKTQIQFFINILLLNKYNFIDINIKK
ncbi:hypothetical protein DDB_G0291944 [Dictyostelium discoideum AX4]|uniref:hypothetical protein n=1 Tax=Dictyostelium discoideum AX4 TaxID=352472 RepID=UPI00004E2EC4|nr:hypothetical protein DDB_G0291944 [Dictyostelium discoideum AX4]EAL61502.1 hypothetical protein DDB_G0291944 [Dictyostelium discoideum AX4]|eukprot:XP_629903.1 hypothetical protein DDB_G0291944 [Dictyostelium discoideum AX4]